jgi:hypothetical protein
MRIALKPIERLDVLRALVGDRGRGDLFPFSVLDMGEDILVGVTRIRKGISRLFFPRDVH